MNEGSSSPDAPLSMVGSLAAWGLKPLPTTEAVAGWLGLSLRQLAWFSDSSMARRDLREPLLHYRYHPKPKPGGIRLLEAPKSRLKTYQRKLLGELLSKIPVHEAVHGFRPGRSVRTHAALHAGHRMVLRIDLRDFFPSVGAARVQATFSSCGYPAPVARVLAGLCTHRAPLGIFRAYEGAFERSLLRQAERLYATQRHLPQGAPTSPWLANLCAFRLDRRLAGLARSFGAVYSRYADDLTFSGEEHFARRALRFFSLVCEIAAEEGFSVNARKTRFLPRSVRQRVCGVVINEHPNLDRRSFDRLKATLTNCVRLGPEGQNRDHVPDFRAHLAGRVAWACHLNPARGAKLQRLFEAIAWSAP